MTLGCVNSDGLGEVMDGADDPGRTGVVDGFVNGLDNPTPAGAVETIDGATGETPLGLAPPPSCCLFESHSSKKEPPPPEVSAGAFGAGSA